MGKRDAILPRRRVESGVTEGALSPTLDPLLAPEKACSATQTSAPSSPDLSAPHAHPAAPPQESSRRLADPWLGPVSGLLEEAARSSLNSSVRALSSGLESPARVIAPLLLSCTDQRQLLWVLLGPGPFARQLETGKTPVREPEGMEDAVIG